MVTTIIFDLDDTLYDEVEYCRSGFRAVAAYIAERFGAGAGELYDSMWQEFASGDRRRIFDAVLEGAGVSYDAECIATLVEVYREHHPRLRLPEDSRAVLEELGGKYKLAMLTDGYLPAQRLKVQALGIEKYFSKIVYTEELGRENWKPSPLGFQKVMFDLKAEAGECVYVADNEEKDFVAPNLLGMTSIKVMRPFPMHPAAAIGQEAQPAHVILQLSELPRLLARL